MTADQFKTIIEEVFQQKLLFPWWQYVLWFFLLAGASYLGSYLREKGKNVATREDVRNITNEIEDVRSTYAKEMQEISRKNDLLLEQYKGIHQLRLAALDKRMESHQQAYTLWRELKFSVYDKDKLNPMVMQCQDWWNKNCLYLSEEARRAFIRAYSSAHNHLDFLRDVRTNPELVTRNWDDIERAGDIIADSVALPSLTDMELVLIPSRKEALLEILGKIAPLTLAIMNEATSPRDLEDLRRRMGKLHARLELLAPLFTSEKEVKDAILNLGQIGGGAVSVSPKVDVNFFEQHTKCVSAITEALATIDVQKSA